MCSAQYWKSVGNGIQGKREIRREEFMFSHAKVPFEWMENKFKRVDEGYAVAARAMLV
jgi:hypothetical protein